MSDNVPTVRLLPGPATNLMPMMYTLDALGYVEEEYVVEGVAASYRHLDDRHPHGRWEVAETGTTAPYRTRILVRRPADLAACSGTVVVEWNNVSGGIDAMPDWGFLHRHLVRRGDVWVGVTAQKVGVDGGGMYPGMHLKMVNPDRYGGLEHPGDAFCFDMFSQAGRALRAGGADGPLGGLEPRRLLAVGESQSAMCLTTYVNAIDPLAQVYDGFLIHGRPSVAAELGGMDLIEEGMDIGEALAEIAEDGEHIRHDARVPVVVLQSETDVTMMKGHLARPVPGDRVRLWELAGTSHADTYLLKASMFDDGTLPPERLAAEMRPFTELFGLMSFDRPINAGPHQHYVGQAAYEALDRWAGGGAPPPVAPLLELDGTGGDLERDELGIARGGVRSPWVDVPLSVLSGLGQTGEAFAAIFGTTEPLDPAVLAARYPGGRDDYLAAFTTSLDETISGGFVLPEDRDEILAVAAAAYELEVGAASS